MSSARKVVTRSPKRTVGLINCRWFQDKPIEHESRLEKHFVYVPDYGESRHAEIPS